MAQNKEHDGEYYVQQYYKSKDPVLKEKAIKSFLPLVKYIIGRINLPAIGILKKEDVYQYGIIGLIEALDRFDPDVGVNFKTFAYKRIYGSVMDAIRKSGIWNRQQIKKINNVIEITNAIQNELGRVATVEEICKKGEITEKEYYKVMNLTNLNFTLSLDDKIGSSDENSLTRKDIITDENQIPPHVRMQKESMKMELKNYIRELPEKPRLVLALYYYEELTLSDIGQVLAISESRVSQILNQTLVELRIKLKQK